MATTMAPRASIFLTDAELDALKPILRWGTYGKGGAEHCGGTCPDHRLQIKNLVDCDTEHLQAILRNQRQVHIGPSSFYSLVIGRILQDRGVTPEDFSPEAEKEFSQKATEGYLKRVRGENMNFQVPDLNAAGTDPFGIDSASDTTPAPTVIPDSVDIDLTGFIFVFGANAEGAHGGGAARVARTRYGAIWGQAEGFQGDAYGIITCGKPVGQPGYELPLSDVHASVQKFLDDAVANPDKNFQVTRVGCGLAATKDRGDAQLAPLFLGAPSNVYFDTQWKPFLEPTANFWGHKG